jgi:hypothetical protein
MRSKTRKLEYDPLERRSVVPTERQDLEPVGLFLFSPYSALIDILIYAALPHSRETIKSCHAPTRHSINMIRAHNYQILYFENHRYVDLTKPNSPAAKFIEERLARGDDSSDPDDPSDVPASSRASLAPTGGGGNSGS